MRCEGGWSGRCGGRVISGEFDVVVRSCVIYSGNCNGWVVVVDDVRNGGDSGYVVVVGGGCVDFDGYLRVGKWSGGKYIGRCGCCHPSCSSVVRDVLTHASLFVVFVVVVVAVVITTISIVIVVCESSVVCCLLVEEPVLGGG